VNERDIAAQILNADILRLFHFLHYLSCLGHCTLLCSRLELIQISSLLKLGSLSGL